MDMGHARATSRWRQSTKRSLLAVILAGTTLAVLSFVPWARFAANISGRTSQRIHLTVVQLDSRFWVVTEWCLAPGFRTSSAAELYESERAAELDLSELRDLYVESAQLRQHPAPGRMAYDIDVVRSEVVPSWMKFAEHPPEAYGLTFHPDDPYLVSEFAVGWPFRAFRAETVAPSTGPPERKRGYLDLGPLGVVPCLPIWRGLVLDVLVLGSAWWVVLSCLSVLRRRRRIRRGLCVFCKYDRSGLDAAAVCPECGGTTTPTPERGC